MIPSFITWGDWAAKGSIDYDPARDWITDMNPSTSILGSPTSLMIGAEELLPALNNCEHVILSEFGHFGDVWGFQTEARRHLLATFYDTGEVDDSLFTYQPMDFHVGLGFPAMAKIALGIVVLVISGLVAIVGFVVRRVRRRKAAQAA